MLSPLPRLEKWSSVVGKAHSFWRLAVTATLSCGQERHLDAELPTDATELESTNRRCSSLCENSEDTEAPELHLRILCGVLMLDWTEEPDIGILCPQSEPQVLIRKDGYVEVCDLEIYREKTVLESDLWNDFSQSYILKLSCMTESFRTRRSKMGRNPPSLFGTMKYRL